MILKFIYIYIELDFNDILCILNIWYFYWLDILISFNLLFFRFLNYEFFFVKWFEIL